MTPSLATRAERPLHLLADRRARCRDAGLRSAAITILSLSLPALWSPSWPSPAAMWFKPRPIGYWAVGAISITQVNARTIH